MRACNRFSEERGALSGGLFQMVPEGFPQG